MQERYCLEFILDVHGSSAAGIKSALSEFGEHLEIVDCTDAAREARSFKIVIHTEDPTLVFDICSQFGRIKSVKVNEEGRS
jgi:dihydroxyacetone kinase-like predicted kinase